MKEYYIKLLILMLNPWIRLLTHILLTLLIRFIFIKYLEVQQPLDTVNYHSPDDDNDKYDALRLLIKDKLIKYLDNIETIKNYASLRTQIGLIHYNLLTAFYTTYHKTHIDEFLDKIDYKDLSMMPETLFNLKIQKLIEDYMSIYEVKEKENTAIITANNNLLLTQQIIYQNFKDYINNRNDFSHMTKRILLYDNNLIPFISNIYLDSYVQSYDYQHNDMVIIKYLYIEKIINNFYNRVFISMNDLITEHININIINHKHVPLKEIIAFVIPMIISTIHDNPTSETNANAIIIYGDNVHENIIITPAAREFHNEHIKREIYKALPFIYLQILDITFIEIDNKPAIRILIGTYLEVIIK